MKRIVFCLLPLVLLGFSGGGSLFGGGLYENEIPPFTIPSTRNYGMGGPHTAYTDDINSLFINPGALAATRQISIAELSLGTHGDVWGMVDALRDGGTDALLTWVENTKGNIPLGLNLRGPLAVGKVTGDGWGWGVFDRVYTDISVAGSTISIGLYGDLVGTVGYAMRVVNTGAHTVDVGVLAKTFGRVSMDTGKLKLLNMVSDFENWQDYLTGSFMTVGGGLDIGAQYRFLDNLSAALVVGDLFSLGHVAPLSIPGLGSASGSAYLGYISPKINVGLSYKIFENYLVTWALMADYRDLINLFQQNDYYATNGFLNLSLGTEVILLNMFSFRAGMNQLLPAAGIGFDLKALKIDAAIYGKELGREPGQLSTYALDVGLLFRY